MPPAAPPPPPTPGLPSPPPSWPLSPLPPVPLLPSGPVLSGAAASGFLHAPPGLPAPFAGADVPPGRTRGVWREEPPWPQGAGFPWEGDWEEVPRPEWREWVERPGGRCRPWALLTVRLCCPVGVARPHRPGDKACGEGRTQALGAAAGWVSWLLDFPVETWARAGHTHPAGSPARRLAGQAGHRPLAKVHGPTWASHHDSAPLCPQDPRSPSSPGTPPSRVTQGLPTQMPTASSLEHRACPVPWDRDSPTGGCHHPPQGRGEQGETRALGWAGLLVGESSDQLSNRGIGFCRHLAAGAPGCWGLWKPLWGPLG